MVNTRIMIRSIILAAGLLLYITAAAQPQTIRLWTGEIDGAIQDESYSEDALILDNYNTWVTRVTEPTLRIYDVPKDKSIGISVIICPGGGYSGLAIDKEGYEIAKWLNWHGITAFVLKYRLPSDAIMEDKTIGPLQDAQEAIRLVRRNAGKWNLDPGKIGIMGFSAGGHLASTLSTHYDEKVYNTDDTTSARPDFSLLIYPVISMREDLTHMGSRLCLLGEDPDTERVERFSNELMVNAGTPPAFLVHSTNDEAVKVENSIGYYLALLKAGVRGEMHIYQEGGHGFGLARLGGTQSEWPGACLKWLMEF
jgi:acetyl esterase/lipase